MSATPSTTALLVALFARCHPTWSMVVTAVEPSTGRGDDPWKDRNRCTHRAFPVAEAADVAHRCARWGPRRNVYIRATPVTGLTSARGTEADTAALVALWADIDWADPGHAERPDGLPHPPDADAAEELLDDVGDPPSLVIHTGGGFHAWWILDEPVAAPVDELKAASTRWATHLTETAKRRGWHVDDVGDLTRLLRPPATWRLKPGTEPTKAKLHHVAGYPEGGLYALGDQWRPDLTYGLDELLAGCLEPEPPPPPASTPARRTSGTGNYGPAHAVSELTWSQILEPAGFTFVDHEHDAERWVRPGDPKSAHSLKCWPGAACVWSGNAGLPVGKDQKLSKWRVFCHLYFDGDERRAGLELRSFQRERKAARS